MNINEVTRFSSCTTSLSSSFLLHKKSSLTILLFLFTIVLFLGVSPDIYLITNLILKSNIKEY